MRLWIDLERFIPKATAFTYSFGQDWPGNQSQGRVSYLGCYMYQVYRHSKDHTFVVTDPYVLPGIYSFTHKMVRNYFR